MVNGCIYIALLVKALYNLPLTHIHTGAHTHTQNDGLACLIMQAIDTSYFNQNVTYKRYDDLRKSKLNYPTVYKIVKRSSTSTNCNN